MTPIPVPRSGPYPLDRPLTIEELQDALAERGFVEWRLGFVEWRCDEAPITEDVTDDADA